MTKNEAYQLAAQCWCTERTSHIEMDGLLAEAFADKLLECQASLESKLAIADNALIDIARCDLCGEPTECVHEDQNMNLAQSAISKINEGEK